MKRTKRFVDGASSLIHCALPTPSKVTAADFDRVVAEAIGPYLATAGWHPVKRSNWLRQNGGGTSRLALDPRRQCAQSSVLLGWDPDEMTALLNDLFRDELPLEARGFLCGPYLTPAGVSRRPRFWHSRTKAPLLRSILEVQCSLEKIGEPWLTSLRDPVTYAEQADPVAALGAGFAWERAGQMDRARPFYEEMLRRVEAAMAIRSRKPILDSMKRQYLFLTDRLGRAGEMADRLRSELGGPAAE